MQHSNLDFLSFFFVPVVYLNKRKERRRGRERRRDFSSFLFYSFFPIRKVLFTCKGILDLLSDFFFFKKKIAKEKCLCIFSKREKSHGGTWNPIYILGTKP
jgi:hypothetical protein